MNYHPKSGISGCVDSGVGITGSTVGSSVGIIGSSVGSVVGSAVGFGRTPDQVLHKLDFSNSISF